MKQYNDALRFILENGITSEDRTGEGTISHFGYQMRFDLQKGFPAVTTKKLAWKSVVSELLWFLEGSTDERRLAEILHGTRDSNKETIWTANALEQGRSLGYDNGELGPVYGYHWRYIYNNECFPVKKKKAVNDSFNFDGFEATVHGIGMIGNYDLNNETPINKRLRNIWEKMISNCYNPKDEVFQKATDRAIVSNRWLVLSNFIEDAKELDGWLWFIRHENVVLEKDYYGVNNIYCKETSVFIPKEHSELYHKKSKPIIVKHKDIPTRYFINEEEYKIVSPIGEASTYDNKDFVIRHQFPVDQIATLIKQIKQDPNSRRLLLTSLDFGSVNKASLPPCHTFAQFYVRNGKLSCQMYQRSADFFLGVPFNIASYSLLIHMIAQVCNLEVGEFVHSFGDAHIYLNHIEAVNEQLSREPYPLPTLKINKDVKDINKFTMNDFELVDYKHHPKIKAKMAV